MEKLLGKNIPLKTDISVVGYSANSESALYHTSYSVVGYIADFKSALYDIALIHDYSADLIIKF
jgi:hypothetical protein